MGAQLACDMTVVRAASLKQVVLALVAKFQDIGLYEIPTVVAEDGRTGEPVG